MVNVGLLSCQSGGASDLWEYDVEPDLDLKITWSQTFGYASDDSGMAVLEVSEAGPLVLGTRGALEVWLLQTDWWGALLWNATYHEAGGGTHQAQAGIVCQDGGYAILAANHISTGADAMWAATWLLRLDAEGTLLWNRTFHYYMWDVCAELVECDDGGFLLGGYILYNPFFLEDPPARFEAWLVKTDSAGNILWNYTYGDYTLHLDAAYSLVKCSAGGYAFAGTTAQDPRGLEMWLVRVSNNGTLLWQTTFGGEGDDECYDLVECEDGGFVLSGFVKDTVTNAPAAIALKTDQNGMQLWNCTSPGLGEAQAQSLVALSNGNFAITGSTGYTSMPHDVCFWLIDQNGEHLYNMTMGGLEDDRGRCIAMNSTESFVITGYTESYGAGERDLWLLFISEIPPPSGDGWRNLLFLLLGVGIGVAVILIVVVLIFIRRRKTEE
ncbi:MAG: hypothetical protein ACFFD8_04525 [Candidatus Thorarchaeota archaeon]